MRYWTEAEDELLRAEYGTTPARALADKLRRSVLSVRHRAQTLGVKTPRPWTPAQDARLREAYGKVKSYDLAREFGKTPGAIKQHARQIGLDAARYYTEEEKDLVRQLYPTHTAAQIAKIVFGSGRSAIAIFRMAHLLGLRKWPSFAPEILEEVRRRHKDGECIRVIAAALGLAYEQAKQLHYRLKLKPHVDTDAKRRSIENQAKGLGIKPGGALRVLAMRAYARRHGWPEDLRARSVRILEVLHAGGPMTRRQICDVIGMRWKGTRASLTSNDPEGSYLANLQARGLVQRSAGRAAKGDRRGSSVYLYYLTPLAEEMKDAFQQAHGGQSSVGHQGLAARAAAGDV